MAKFDPTDVPRIQELIGEELASFKDRAIAFLIDFFAAYILFLALLFAGHKLLTSIDLIEIKEDVNLKFDFTNWYSILFLVLYFGVSTYFTNGLTLGKKIMRIRVKSLTHQRMSLWHSFERALGYAASALELGFGFIQYFIHPNKRTVHDRIAETIVVKERKAPKNIE